MIGMIGSGSWATAAVKILLEKPSQKVVWWVHSDAVCRGLSRSGRNPNHLSAMRLDKARIQPTTLLTDVLQSCSMVVLAVPSAYLVATMEGAPSEMWKGKKVVSLVKGYVPETNCGVSDYLNGYKGIPYEDICVVSGPSHAEEVAANLTTFLNVASHSKPLSCEVADLFRCQYIHPIVVEDVHALELCGMSKNVYAVGAGMASALGNGDNLIAVLASAAAREMYSLIGHSEIGFHLLGDLMVTCFSRHSRNRALGEAIVAGQSCQEYFRRTGMVAEGYYSSLVMHNMKKCAPTPIADHIYRVLYENADPEAVMKELIDNLFQ